MTRETGAFGTIKFTSGGSVEYVVKEGGGGGSGVVGRLVTREHLPAPEIATAWPKMQPMDTAPRDVDVLVRLGAVYMIVWVSSERPGTVWVAGRFIPFRDCAGWWPLPKE